MWNLVFSATKLALSTQLVRNAVPKLVRNTPRVRNFSGIAPVNHEGLNTRSLLQHPKLLEINNNIQTRTVTKFSFRKGKRKSVGIVLQKFYRLHWGGWIRTKCGRQKKLWKKSPPRKRRLRQHVLCNSTQSHLLDKMVGRYWTKSRHYVDDPYEPYHTREEFPHAARKPKPYVPESGTTPYC